MRKAQCIGKAITCNLGGNVAKILSVRSAPSDNGAPLRYHRPRNSLLLVIRASPQARSPAAKNQGHATGQGVGGYKCS